MNIWIIVIILILFVFWSHSLIFYRDKNVNDIESDESKCFAPRCHSIVRVHKQKSDTAILMIHGFPSTPHVYEYSSERFFEEGMDAYAFLMPGFGTSVEDFKKTYFTQWFNFICRKYETLKKEYDNVFVLGISMGGAMTLKIGEKYSSTDLEPNAIISISAPVVYNSIKDHLITNKAFVFARFVSLFKSTFNAKEVNGVPERDDGDEDWTGYSGLFLKQAFSLIHAEKKIRKNLPKIKCPLFLIQDVNDKTVPFANYFIIARENGSLDFKGRVTKMKNFNHTHHVLLLYRSIREELTEEIIEYIGERKND